MSSRVGKGARAATGRAPRMWRLIRLKLATWFMAALLAIAGLLSHINPGSADSSSCPLWEGGHVLIYLFKSCIVPFDRPFASAVVAAPEIADVLPMTDRTLYIQAKKIGTTNISVFDESRPWSNGSSSN